MQIYTKLSWKVNPGSHSAFCPAPPRSFNSRQWRYGFLEQVAAQKEIKGPPEEILFYFAKQRISFPHESWKSSWNFHSRRLLFFLSKRNWENCSVRIFFFLTVPETHCLNCNCWRSSNSACFSNTLRSFNELYLIGVFICLVLVNLVQLVLVANIVLEFRLLLREEHKKSKYVR